MNSQILWPVVLQVLLTMIMFILLGARKGRAVKAGEADLKKAALNNSAWPEDVVKVSNNIQNQFQTPVLFYVLVLTLVILDSVTLFSLTVAWLYVISRYAHAYVHVGSNHVPYRFKIFLLGCICLLAMLFDVASSLL